jgi:hypothetical protein
LLVYVEALMMFQRAMMLMLSDSHRYVSNALSLRDKLRVQCLGLLDPEERRIRVPNETSSRDDRRDARDCVAQGDLEDAA